MRTHERKGPKVTYRQIAADLYSVYHDGEKIGEVQRKAARFWVASRFSVLSLKYRAHEPADTRRAAAEALVRRGA